MRWKGGRLSSGRLLTAAGGWSAATRGARGASGWILSDARASWRTVRFSRPPATAPDTSSSASGHFCTPFFHSRSRLLSFLISLNTECGSQITAGNQTLEIC